MNGTKARCDVLQAISSASGCLAPMLCTVQNASGLMDDAGISSFSFNLSDLLVRNLDSASVLWCLIPANALYQDRVPTVVGTITPVSLMRPKLSIAACGIHEHFGRQTYFLLDTAGAVVRHILQKVIPCAFLAGFLVSLQGLDHYVVGILVTSGCCCSNTHPTWVTPASVSRVQWPVACGSTSNGGFGRVFFRPSTANFSSNVSSRKEFCQSFSSALFIGAGSREKFRIHRRKTLQSSRKDRTLVCVVWLFCSRITFVVVSAISNLPSLMSCAR